MTHPRLGQLAVANNFLSRKHLEECLDLQRTSPVPVRLGRLLLEEGLVTERGLKSLLALHGDSESTVSVERQERIDNARPTDLEGLLALAGEMGASRLCLSDGARPFLRLAGEIVSLELPVIDVMRREHYLGDVLTAPRRQRLAKTGSVSFRHTTKDGSCFLTQISQHRKGVSAIFKAQPRRILSLEELGLPLQLAKVTGYQRGLVLVTGPAGSGRTMTLASLLDRFNTEVARRIITLEQSIEVHHTSRRCLITQREVPRHVSDYASALRQTLRCDADVVVINDLSGREEIECALQAVETGHVVLGSLSAASAFGALHRLVDAFAGTDQDAVCRRLADDLRLIISQQLVPRSDRTGNVLASELLVVDTAVAHMIRDNRLQQIAQVLQLGTSQGQVSMDSSLLKLVQDGIIDQTTAMQRSTDVRRWLTDSGDQA